MLFWRGLIETDINLFKEIFQRKKKFKWKKILRKKENYIFRSNFLKRRIDLLRFLSKEKYFRCKRNFSINLNNNNKNLFKISGVHIISNQSCVFFKFLKKKFDFPFLTKKLNFFTRKRFLSKLDHKFICIFEGSVVLKKLLINSVIKNKPGVLWLFLGKKFSGKKKFSLKTSKYYFRCQKYKIYSYYLNFDLDKSIIVKKKNQYIKFFKTSINVNVTTSVLTCDFSLYFGKLNIENEYLIFLEFLFFKFFCFRKKIKLNILNELIQNSIEIDFVQIFFKYYIENKLKWNSKIINKNFKKKKSFEFILASLIRMKN
jgi:hypothetical protein